MTWVLTRVYLRRLDSRRQTTPTSTKRTATAIEARAWLRWSRCTAIAASSSHAPEQMYQIQYVLSWDESGFTGAASAWCRGLLYETMGLSV